MYPENQSVASGAVFQFKATGDGLQFHCQKNCDDIPCDDGRYCNIETDTSCTEEVEQSDKGHYQCTVTAKNNARKKFSDEAHLDISKHIKWLVVLVLNDSKVLI